MIIEGRLLLLLLLQQQNKNRNLMRCLMFFEVTYLSSIYKYTHIQYIYFENMYVYLHIIYIINKYI